MSDVLEELDPQEPVTPEPPAEPDPLAEREAALAKREAELKKFEQEVNKRSTAVGLTAKQLEEAKAALAAAKPEEDDDDFDPQQLKVLEKALKKLGIDPAVITSTVQTTVQRDAEEIRIVGDAFFEAHNDIEPDELFTFLNEMGVEPPKTAARLKVVLERGYKALKAEKDDPDAKATELATKKIQELAEKGETIKEVKPKRSGVSDKKSIDDVVADNSLNFWEKAALMEGMD